jgi:DNA-binding transcriptional MerR regulator/methylmalonyl-CoA mutase cobalamin-binding subunit
MTSHRHPSVIAPSGQGKSWSIAQVERETGLGKDTLRVWEKRYGFPRPGRDAQDERTYPDEQIQQLRLIKRLLDAGHRPGKVVSLPADRLQALLDQETPKVVSIQSAKGEPQLGHAAVWVQWLAQDKVALIRQSLQQHILRYGLGRVVDELVAPLCGMVGQAWMRGDITVYQEHLFTQTLQSVLSEAMASVEASLPAPAQRPRVLLTTTPQELHGLGLLMVECHLALEHCERLVLGTSTPISDIALAVRQMDIDILALSFSAHTVRKDMLDSLTQLRAQLPEEVEIWVGGAGASAHARALPSSLVLMHRVGDATPRVQAWRQRQAGQQTLTG